MSHLMPPVGHVGLAGQRRGPRRPWVDPAGLLLDVVDEENAAVGRHLHTDKMMMFNIQDIPAGHPVFSSTYLHGPSRGQALRVQSGCIRGSGGGWKEENIFF